MNITEFIRPSALDGIERCDGKPTMEARACELVPALREMCGIPAVQGTMGHVVLAGVLSDALTGDWSRAQEVVAGLEGRMMGLLDWTKDAVRQCLAYALRVVRDCTTRYHHVTILVERHLDGAGIDIPRGGSADVVILCQDESGRVVRVVIIDHKTGFVCQGEAADHLQLGAYAVMAWDEWHPAGGVEVHLSAGRRGEFSSALYDAPAIEAVRARIRRAVAAACAPAPQLRPSLKACRWCKALPLCRAAREHLMTAAESQALFGADPADRLALADAAALAKRFAADADALARLWRAQEADKRGATFPN